MLEENFEKARKFPFILHPDVVKAEEHGCTLLFHGFLGETRRLNPSASVLLRSLLSGEDVIDSPKAKETFFELWRDCFIIPGPRAPHTSFVVPAFNSQNTIAETLRSILSQGDFNDIEVIVVDNGSTDGTLRIVDEFPVILLSEERRGRSFARNRGLRAARGEIICFIDSDVTLAPSWLREIKEGFFPRIVVAVQGAMRQTFRSSTGALSLLSHPTDWFLQDENAFLRASPAPFFDTAAVAVRMSFLREQRIFFDETLRRAEDLDISLSILRAGGHFRYCKARVDVELGHGSLFRRIGSLINQGIHDRRVLKKWIPHLGILAPKRWAVNTPGFPVRLARFELAQYFFRLWVRLGWWCETLRETSQGLFDGRGRSNAKSRETSEKKEWEEVTGEPFPATESPIRVAFGSHGARIVEWTPDALMSGTGLFLNPSAAHCLALFLEGLSPQEIAQRFAQQFKIDSTVAHADVHSTLNELKACGVISLLGEKRGENQ